MTRAIGSLAPLGLVLVLAVALVACRTGAERSNYDAAAHERAVAAKSQALSVMASSAEAFSRHSTNVDAVNAEMEEGYRLAVAAPDNAAVTAEWAAMKDPGRDLYGGFVRLWQSGGTVDQATRDAAMNRVTVRFNYILCLEAAKKTTKGGICASPDAPAPEVVETAEPPA